ncbi:MAG: 4-alpha-glucanotransferase [Rhodothermales bacterium]
MDLPRSSGLLLHLTSLPSIHGIGDLGPSAYRFADSLAEAHQRIWQMLPVVPVGYGYSPYASPSTFAGNPMLLSPDLLLEQGLLLADDLAGKPDFPNHYVDFARVYPYKTKLLQRAFDRFEEKAASQERAAFAAFCKANDHWLPDYALFMALKDAHRSVAWIEWPAPLAQRDPDALNAARNEYEYDIRKHTFWQFLFEQQWSALRAYCRQRSIRILGDLPIYVAHDSADVWANPHLFYLDDTGNPTVVAGVPPDYFSETGQRWGNPLYRWDMMQENHFSWWTQRLEKALTLFDIIRLDHFRAFAAYWEVPAEEKTAINGRWVDAPGTEFFVQIEARLGRLPLLAENLGVITDDVTALMERFDFPGMAVLQFAFDTDADSEFLPHNYSKNLAAYPGTHDNDTLIGWWTNNQSTLDAEAVARARAYALQYLNLDPDDVQQIHWRCIRLLMGSVAHLVVTPVQDVLGLGSHARMNTPGTVSDNWGWRLLPDQLTDEHLARLRTLTQLYGRSEDREPPV